MTRKPAAASDAPGAYAAMLKPVFAPSLTPLSLLESRYYMDVQAESYDAQGAPRLHLGGAGEGGTNTLIRINVGGSDLSPALRRVFIPQDPGSTAFLLESIDGEPGLVATAIGHAGSGQASVSVWLMPFAAITDISQGDHDGLMQVNLLQPDTVRTTVNLQRNDAGYLKYSTTDTCIGLDGITPQEAADAQRHLESVLAGRIAAICGQFVFDLAPVQAGAAPGQGALRAVGVSPALKTAAIGLLQIGGLVANGLGFVYGPIASGTAGVLRGVAGLAGLVPATGGGSPVVTGAQYACTINGAPGNITIG